MLKVEHLTKMFGGLAAVNDVSVEFEAGKVNAIIGPNGAGKSTFFNLIAGLHQPTSGRIILDGVDITRMSCDRVAQQGVGRTFQTTNLFEQSTVLDNLIVGYRLRTKSGLWDVLVNSRRLQQEERAARARAHGGSGIRGPDRRGRPVHCGPDPGRTETGGSGPGAGHGAEDSVAG